eukprot:1760477-Rhodomonas_salina.1
MIQNTWPQFEQEEDKWEWQEPVEEEEIDPTPFGPDGPSRGGGGWGQGYPLTGFVPSEAWIGGGGADATVKGTVPWRGPTGPNPDPD